MNLQWTTIPKQMHRNMILEAWETETMDGDLCFLITHNYHARLPYEQWCCHVMNADGDQRSIYQAATSLDEAKAACTEYALRQMQ